MPRIKRGETRVAKTWQQVIFDQIKEKKAIPVLSNSISNELILGDHQQLIRDFAEHVKYPLVDKDNLAHIAQYTTVIDSRNIGSMSAVVVKKLYLDVVKSRLYNLAEEPGGAVRSLLDEVNADTKYY